MNTRTNHRTLDGASWWVGNPPEGKNKGSVMPANVVCYLSITNNADFPVLIQTYGVDMATVNGGFKRLNKIRTANTAVWSGLDMTSVSRIFDDSVMLDTALHGVVPAHGTVRGWGLFQYPTDDGTVFDPSTIKLRISDYGGKSFTSPPLHPLKSIPAQDIVIPLAAGHVSLSGAEFGFEGDEQN